MKLFDIRLVGSDSTTVFLNDAFLLSPSLSLSLCFQSEGSKHEQIFDGEDLMYTVHFHVVEFQSEIFTLDYKH